MGIMEFVEIILPLNPIIPRVPKIPISHPKTGFVTFADPAPNIQPLTPPKLDPLPLRERRPHTA